MAPKVVMTMADWRLDVLLEPQRTGLSVAEVCRRHEISRQTFYVWKRRFDAVGVAGLLERSRVPIAQPRRTEADMEERICTLRRRHPRWGAKTISVRLGRAGSSPPSVSTIHRILRRNRLVVPAPKKKPRGLVRRFERAEPNDLWQMDSKQIVLTDGSRAEVVSVLDDHARFMLAGVVCTKATCAATWAAFVSAARAYGLPRQLFTDNHLSFTGRLYGKVVAFERNVTATGAALICGRPRHPQGRGKIERFHQTLQAHVDDAGGAADVDELQHVIDRFRREYNEDRPHQAIGDLTPAERYRPSERSLGHIDARVDPDYPPGAIVRKASVNGVVCWNYIKIALGRQWGGRRVRIELDDGWIHVLVGDLVVRSVQHHPDVIYHRLPKAMRVG